MIAIFYYLWAGIITSDIFTAPLQPSSCEAINGYLSWQLENRWHGILPNESVPSFYISWAFFFENSTTDFIQSIKGQALTQGASLLDENEPLTSMTITEFDNIYYPPANSFVVIDTLGELTQDLLVSSPRVLYSCLSSYNAPDETLLSNSTFAIYTTNIVYRSLADLAYEDVRDLTSNGSLISAWRSRSFDSSKLSGETIVGYEVQRPDSFSVEQEMISSFIMKVRLRAIFACPGEVNKARFSEYWLKSPTFEVNPPEALISFEFSDLDVTTLYVQRGDLVSDVQFTYYPTNWIHTVSWIVTNEPSAQPTTNRPSNQPSVQPTTSRPSNQPSARPTIFTNRPSNQPTTLAPSTSPSNLTVPDDNPSGYNPAFPFILGMALVGVGSVVALGFIGWIGFSYWGLQKLVSLNFLQNRLPVRHRTVATRSPDRMGGGRGRYTAIQAFSAQ